MKTQMNMKKAGGVLAITGVALMSATGVNAQSQIEAQKTSFLENMKAKMQNMKKDFAGSLTEAQKQTLEEAKKLRDAGKHEEAHALMEKAGIKKMGGKGGNGHAKGHGENRKAVEDAIVSGNYSNFQAVASNTPLKSISLDVFNQLVPQFQAKKAAHDKIQEILKAAGIQAPTGPQNK